MSELWTVQRPATIWLTVKVKAETLEEALELADVEFSNGEYKEDDFGFSIDEEKFWAIDEYKNVFTEDTKQGTNA